MKSLNELLQEQLRDLYDAEVQYDSRLPGLQGKATNEQLRDALAEIADNTRSNIGRLEEVCGALGVNPAGVMCEAMKGLIREANGTIYESGDTATIDASLIANAQRIAHYEIAGFGTAREFARCLRLDGAAAILAELNNQAKMHDKMLTQIATGGWFSGGINQEAVTGA